MPMMIELVRKIDLADPRSAGVLATALKNGFQVRTGAMRVATDRPIGPVKRRRRNRRTVRRIDDSMGRRIREMRENGVAFDAIAKAMSLSSSGIRNYLSRVGA